MTRRAGGRPGLDSALSRLRARTAKVGAGSAGITPVPRDRPLELAFAQQRLWFLDRLMPGSAFYNFGSAVRVRGPLRTEVLGRALSRIVARHETLRTVFTDDAGVPSAVIQPAAPVPVPVVDVADEAEAERLAGDEAARPFDLREGPLFRARLLRLAEDDHILLLTVHHIATDGWSHGVLWAELTAAYAALADGREPVLPELRVQYVDFAAWQRRTLPPAELERRLEFWRETLAGLTPLELPLDRPRPAVASAEGGVVMWRLPADVVAAARAVGEQQGATLHMTLLAAFSIVLARHARTEDVAVAQPVAGRPMSEVENLIGFFVNTVVTRTDLSGDPTFRELVDRVRTASVDAMAHQDVPFEYLVEKLVPERDLSRNPLAQVVFQVVQGPTSGPAAFSGTTTEPFAGDRAFTRMDLEIYLGEDADGGVGGLANYSRALFDAETVEGLARHLTTVLRAAAEAPDAPLSRLPMTDADERSVLLAAAHGTTVPLPDGTLHALFAAQAARTPDTVAVVDGADAWTYAELDRAANRLAHVLRDRGVGPEHVVALAAERSVRLVVAVLAVLKAGGAYLPLDGRNPAGRTRAVLAATGAALLLADRDEAVPGAEDLPVADLRADLGDVPDTAPDDAVHPDGLAYVMSTSGSTGTPKGVVVTHRAVAALALDRRWANGAHERVLLHSPHAFDASTYELWSPLLSGRCVVVAPPGAIGPRAIARVVAEYGVTALWLTSGLFDLVAEENVECLAGLREVIAGGDTVLPGTVARVRAAHPGLTVLNGYGPTETTTFATVHAMAPGDPSPAGRVPIGLPIDNTTAYVLDDRLRPVPFGVPGELYVAGAGLARGYAGRPLDTAERFLPDPFGPPGTRMYRTGDVVRRRAAGVLEFLGRADGQVKLRGFRVEPGEVEAVLAGHPAVAHVAVVVRGDGAAGRQLVSYVVPRANVDGGDVAALRTYASAALPDYLVPSAYVLLDALPLAATGKIDRAALPAPEEEEGAGHVAPRTETERALCGIFAEVLGVADIGAEDDFFVRGGHSLLATRVIARVASVLGAEVPLRELFEHRTARALAAVVAAAGATNAPPLVAVEREGPLPLSFAQQRLWFLDQLAPGNASYTSGGAMRVRGGIDPARLAEALSAVVARHEALRTTFAVEDGVPVAVIGAPAPVPLPLIEVDGVDAARAAASAELSIGFDLAHGPLLRATLLRLGQDDHVLVVAVHHVATDGWSQALLWAEVAAAYSGSAPADLPVQYADFAVWQRSWLSGDVLERRADYWIKRLADLGPLELPLDKARPAVATGRAGALPWAVPAELVRAARAVAAQEGATLYMALLAAFNVVLSRYARTDDVAVGSPTAGRTHAEVEALIGFFVNVVVVRTDTSGDPTFRELLGRVRESAVGAVEHQDVPFEHLVERLRPQRDLSRNPLAQVAFQLLTGAPGWPSWAGAEVEHFDLDHAYTRMDLEVHAVEVDDDVTATVLYAADLFDADTVRQLMRHVTVVLGQVLADPDRPISAATMLDDADRHRVLVEWNDTAAPLPDGSVPRLYAEQAARTPDAVALVCGDERVTYAELDRRANRFAHILLAQGVGPDEPVGVATGRSANMVAAVLGVLKAGGAYVPLDPRNPAGRTERIVATSGLRLVIADRPVPGTAGATVLDVDHPGDAPDTDPGIDPPRDSTAYVIYTSGSSGEPKGVAVTHGNVVVLAADRRWLNGNHERVLLHFPLATDISAYELWPFLLAGKQVVIAADEHVEPQTFDRLIREHGVTAMCLPAPLFSLLVEECLPCFEGLREVLTGGEAVSGETVARVMAAHPQLTVVDAYGPTEATAFATLFPMEPGFTLTGSRVPIGAPIDNTRVYVVDSDLTPVPLGVAGELVIAGPRVARGYVGMPELTAEKFVPDPWGPSGARMYRTGDVVRWLPGGALEFLGRIDAQVKIRGFRVELGEIEAVLLRHPAVSQVTVAVREDVPGDKRLVTYVVLEPGSDESVLPALRAHAAGGVPDYMVPSAFVALDRFPLSTTGKIDRRALPAPDARSVAEAGYVPPTTEPEKALCEIFAEVLEVQPVGVDDDFFALGGHSLLATRAIAKIRARFGPDVALQSLFELRTPRRLAEAVGDLATEVEVIRPAPRDGALPLSFSQQRLWFLDRLTPDSGFWNVAMGVRARGPFDADAFRGALSAVVARHEALRTVFADGGGGTPVAVVQDTCEIPLAVTDVAGEAEAQALAAADAALPFDLARGPLLRARVLRLAPQDHAVLITVHHAATDGWSHAVFWGELAEAYTAALEGREPVLPELPVQYGDFAVWQRAHLTGAVLDGHVEYWRDRLAGLRPLELPLDHPRPAVATSAGASQSWELPEDLVRAARALGDDEGATLYMTLLAAFSVVLARFAGTEDVAVGTPVAGRTRAEVERLIGFFVNMLVLRTDLSGDPTFRELLGRVRESAVGALEHQDVPFEHLVEALAPERDLSRNPLVQVVFQLMRAPGDKGDRLGGARLEPLLDEHAFTRVDLEVHLTEDGDRVRGTVLHATALFEAETVRRLLHHLTVVLRGALADPDAPLSAVSLLDDADRYQLLEGWNNTAVPYRDASLAELFAEQAARTPDARAVEYGDDTLTYTELDRAAERVARQLRAHGVRPDDLVGLCLDRSTAMIVGLVGVLKAGAAYVPIDPTHPRERVRLIVDDTGMTVAVTERAHAGVFADDTALVLLDALPDGDPAVPAAEADGPGPDSLAYVVYTSGSTGTPKGIAMPARCVVNMLAWQKKAVPGGPGTRTAQFTALTFDVSVQEVLSALLYGETLVIPADEVRRDPARFARWLDERAIEQAFVPNLMIRALAEEANAGRARLTSLRHMSQAGEPLSLDAVLREFCAARPWLRIHNHYGSTEIQVVTAFTLPADVADWPGTAHLGWPVDNSRAYVLDRELRPVPVGVAGELCFAGPGLARGYIGKPELTAGKFVPDPFGPPGSRLYRTGDLGRWRPDGSLEFLGRLDHQVKVRGFRVELGEVEAVLLRHPEVTRAVVVAREDTPGVKRLVGYVVAAPGADGNLPARLRAHLAEAVPDYMVPSAFVVLDAFPLTTTGKVDRGALPSPDLRTTLDVGFAVAGSREEEALCGIFREVLEAERIGVDDDFFALGGHSLVAARTVARIREVLGVEVSLRELFHHRTPRALAEVVAAAPRSAVPPLVPVEKDRPLPLSLTQRQLWQLHEADPDDAVWTIPLALRLGGNLDIDLLGRALTEVVRRHEVLRTVFVPGDEPATVVLPPAEIELLPVDVPDEAAARAAAGVEAARPFDLVRGPVLRPTLLRIAPDDHVLLLMVHHIATDGWSQGVLWSEMSQVYAALSEGRAPRLPELPLQYGDFAVWQRSWLTGAVLDEQLDHWRDRLRGLQPLVLPGARARVAGDNAGVLTEWRLPAELVDAARQVGAAHGATLYMTLLAAFTATLARATGSHDLAVGSPVAGRTRAEVEGMVGFFANFVPLRVGFDGDPSFADLLGRVHTTAVDAYAHQALPWERVAEGLGLDPGEPLVDVVFQLVNVELGELRLPGVRVEPFAGERVYARWNLEVHLVEDPDGGLTGHVVHRAAVHDQTTVDVLLADTATLLSAALADPGLPVSALPMSDPLEGTTHA
ncbi:amino acid adenylation domain-containing protein [Streptomyces sp. ACA25]|uniref:non-ribosomal peptide synthetase n=1 Tax=Streptomyces sp. ACA25 TaxID=3022596 RepID=UPI0023078AC2|nr:non-ribosomal peptide synthetase [Streptomyces sp. ACA25]MDB1088666.1 amino acid adenylation domain-containing protein [Streptomyces sp. ACA25]